MSVWSVYSHGTRILVARALQLVLARIVAYLMPATSKEQGSVLLFPPGLLFRLHATYDERLRLPHKFPVGGNQIMSVTLVVSHSVETHRPCGAPKKSEHSHQYWSTRRLLLFDRSPNSPCLPVCLYIAAALRIAILFVRGCSNRPEDKQI